MKILWICNTMPLRVADYLGMQVYDKEGWVSGIAERILEKNEMELAIAFPQNCDELEQGQAENLKYFMFPRKQVIHKYDRAVEGYLKRIYHSYRPDIVHVFGTEMPHALSALQVMEDPSKIVFSMQGLVARCAEHFFADLPIGVIYGYSLRDLLKNDNLYMQKKKFEKRAVFENELFSKAQNVIGRTEWDYACVKYVNEKVNYYFCNESLRKIFYGESVWNYRNCEKRSIFVCQASYPLKGFHYIIPALAHIVKKYPDTHLYVAGPDIFHEKNLREKLGHTKYTYYLKKLIKAYGVQDQISFTGPLSAEEMRDMYLKSNVFVSASTLENSPNSVGEAMILGVPVVASDVGGTRSIFTDKEDGYLYQYSASYMLAYYVEKVFEEKEKIEKLTSTARKHALEIHDFEKNYQQLLKIYHAIIEKAGNNNGN